MGSWLHGNPCHPVYFHGRLGPMQSQNIYGNTCFARVVHGGMDTHNAPMKCEACVRQPR